MVRIKKIIICLHLMLLSFCFSLNNDVYAKKIADPSKGIYAINHLATYLFGISKPDLSEKISYIAPSNTGVGGYTALDTPLINVLLNDSPAYCINPRKDFPIGTQYTKVEGSEIVGSWINRLYNYGKKQTDKFKNKIATVIFWQMGDTAFKVNSVNNGAAQYLKANADSPFATKEKFREAFRDNITIVISDEKGVGTGLSSSEAKFLLPRYLVYRCLYEGLAYLNSGQNNIPSSCKLSNWFVEDNPSEFVDKDGDGKNDTFILRFYQTASSSNDIWVENEYTLYDYNSAYSLVSDLYTLSQSGATDSELKKKIQEFFNTHVSGQYEAEASQEVENMISDVYDEIGNTPATGKLAVYCPKDSNKEQCIIAPDGDELETNSCSNHLQAFKDMGFSEAEIKEQYGDELNLIEYTDLDGKTHIKCSNRNDECVKFRNAWITLTRVYVGHSPKLGDLYITTVAPYTVDGGEEIKCDCDYYAELFTKSDSKIPSEYRETCEKFRYYYTKIAKVTNREKDIKLCNDSITKEAAGKPTPYAVCDKPTITTSYKCNSYLPNGYTSFHTCSELLATISSQAEKDKVSCTDDGTKITSYSCNMCKPYIHVDNLKCDVKWRQSSKLHLQDATKDSDGNGPRWDECIKNDISYMADGNKIASIDNNMGSSYCTVYCWEQFDLQLPADPAATNFYANGSTNINAGKLFWWGLDYNRNIFGVIEANRICRTEPNYKKFEDDWAANEKDIMQKYANYMAQKNYYDNINNIEIKPKECELEAAKPGSGCCKIWRNGPNTGFSGECRNISDSACFGIGTYDYSGGGTPPVMGIQYYKEKVKQDVYDINGNKYSGESQELTTSCLSKGSGVPSGFDWGSQAKSEMESRKNKLTSTSDGAISNRTRLIAAIKKCQDDKLSYSEIYNYTFKMEITDTAIQNTWGVKTLVMDGSRGDESITTNKDSQVTYSQTLNCNLIDDGDMKVSSDPCRNLDNDFYSVQYGGKSFKIRTYKPFEWNYKGHYYIKYPSSFHFIAYPNDDNVQSIDVTDDNRELLRIVYGLSYDEGMGIPTKINIYGGNFSIGVKMSGYGNDSHFDKLAESGDFSDEFEPIKGGKYVCPYTMANPLYTPPGDDDCPDKNCGIQLVYRIIEMASGNKSRIFPGREGNDGNTNRRIGSNWASFVDTNKFKKITSTGEIYGKNPLYSIELSPSLISEIRRNNNSYRDNGKDPYTSYQDTNNNFKITCQFGSEKGKASLQSCTSNYITDLIKRGKITGRFAEGNEELRRKMILEYK